MESSNGRYNHIRSRGQCKDYASFWKSVKIRFYNPSNETSKESYINYLASNINTKKITTDKISTAFPKGNSLEGYTTIQGIYVGKFPGDEELYRNSLKTILNEQKLETLDEIRDEILKTPGNQEFKIYSNPNNNVSNLFKEIQKSATNKLS